MKFEEERKEEEERKTACRVNMKKEFCGRENEIYANLKKINDEKDREKWQLTRGTRK